MESESFDVVVVGCGPGGSTLAAYLAKAGVSVLAIEKVSFPRYHIGESLTGMAANVLSDFGLEAEMDRLGFPRKGGVKVIGKDAKSEFFVPVQQSTWQVRRAEFDQTLLENAISHGAVYRQGVVKQVLRQGKGVKGITYVREGETEVRTVHAWVVVDASGSAKLFSRLGIVGPAVYNEFSQQVAIFSQVRDAKRDPGEMGDNTFLFYSEVHNWAWFIPISKDTVSVGVVLPNERVRELGGPEEAFRWGISSLNPDLGWRVEGCEQVEPVRAIANYSYAVDPFVGDGWLCVGDSHQFNDPIFSFGVSFALVEARAASTAIHRYLSSEDWRGPFHEYRDFCLRGQTAALDVIRYFWRFPVFFGYQSRGALRKDIIQLLGSNCHAEEELESLEVMRKALRKYGPGSEPARAAA